VTAPINLDVSANQLYALPAWVADLPPIMELRVSGNQLKGLPNTLFPRSDVLIEMLQRADISENLVSRVQRSRPPSVFVIPKEVTLVSAGRRSNPVSLRFNI
jgi:hypothetical protein